MIININWAQVKRHMSLVANYFHRINGGGFMYPHVTV
ncbi:hypothetical protein D781_1960 [Serratia sp. FGI94]|nr:hypothetical protein D781_1960 [Serratia sp. FGI94]